MNHAPGEPLGTFTLWWKLSHQTCDLKLSSNDQLDPHNSSKRFLTSILLLKFFECASSSPSLADM
jgi:hypothetical protein